eukprot:scaffold89681_cov42-Prasinocladus_malaysianus.AAC.1
MGGHGETMQNTDYSGSVEGTPFTGEQTCFTEHRGKSGNHTMPYCIFALSLFSSRCHTKCDLGGLAIRSMAKQAFHAKHINLKLQEQSHSYEYGYIANLLGSYGTRDRTRTRMEYESMIIRATVHITVPYRKLAFGG